MRVNMEDKELVEYLIPNWKGERPLLFFLIVVINVWICIRANIKLDTFEINFHIHWWVNCLFYYGKWRVIHPLNGLAVEFIYSLETSYLIHLIV